MSGSCSQELKYFNLNNIYLLRMDSFHLVGQFLDLSNNELGRNEEQRVTAPLVIKKNSRWSENQWALYVSFSLERLADYQISFLCKRRPYSHFDREFVEFLFQEQKIEVSQTKSKNKIMKIKAELIKRTKSKFRSLKRSFFYKEESLEENFSHIILKEADRLIREGKNKHLQKVIKAKEKFQENKERKNKNQEGSKELSSFTPADLHGFDKS